MSMECAASNQKEGVLTDFVGVELSAVSRAQCPSANSQHRQNDSFHLPKFEHVLMEMLQGEMDGRRRGWNDKDAPGVTVSPHRLSI